MGHSPFSSYARAAGKSSRPAHLGGGDTGGPAARGLGFLVMMCDVRLQTVTPANVLQDQLFRNGGHWLSKSTGVDKTGPHTGNIWTRDGTGRQGTDLGINIPGGGGLLIHLK